MRIVLILIFIPFWLRGGNCIYHFNYSGQPGDVKEDVIELPPNSVIQFDYSTLNVPDKLIIYTNNGELVFNIGTNITHINPIPPDYHGYCEFEYDDFLTTVKSGYPTPPSDFNSNLYGPGGMMRLIYHFSENQCGLRFRVEGNKTQTTVYEICVSILAADWQEISDTITIDGCWELTPEEHSGYQDCENYWWKYNNHQITDTPNVIEPSCLGYSDGSIEFLNHSQFNEYNLGIGIHNIVVSNAFCEKTFSIEFVDKTICEYYIPNIISPNGDGLNDVFTIFTKVNYPYELWIFTRWGELIYHQNCISNWTGWSEPNIPVGVYVYQIQILDRQFTGDVTVFR